MTSLIKLASETPRGPARRKLLLAAVAAGISFTKVKAAQPTFVLRALLPMSGVTSQTAEATARHLSLSTREVKAAFPRAVLKVAVRFHSGAFSSLIEFPGADPLLVQKFMSERFEEDLYSTTAVSLSAATTVDTVPAGSLALSWTSDGDVVLHGERSFKGAIGAKGFIAAIQETENLLDSLKSIYQKHTAAHVADRKSVV